MLDALFQIYAIFPHLWSFVTNKKYLETRQTIVIFHELSSLSRIVILVLFENFAIKIDDAFCDKKTVICFLTT